MDENKRSKKAAIVFSILLLIIITMGGTIWYLKNEQNKDTGFKDDANALTGIMPGMSEEEIQSRLNMVLDENMMNITINPNPIFENGEAEGQLCIENVKQNHFNYIITIRLDDTNEVIYTSGLVRPNHYVQTAKLDKPLKKGTYNATAIFDAYRDDEQRAGSNAIKMQIEIQN